MTYSFALQSDCWRQVLEMEQSQNSVYETVMSPAQAAAATHSLVNTDTSRLGVLLWFLIHSDATLSSLKSTRVRVNPDDALAIYRDEWTAFGHEVGRDEIDWWVNRKETNLAEFSKRTALALELAQALKESSQALKKIDVERYEELIEQIKTFAVKQSAALELARGKVIGQCYQRHRHQEFLHFLRTLDREFPGKVPLHLVMDNYGTHKHDNVRQWLKRHPRFVLHFVPTSSSWLNLVERWFCELSPKAIRRESCYSVAEEKSAIDAFLAAWNNEPKPFVWTATVESITEKLSRCRQTLEKIQPGCTIPRTRKKKKIPV